MPTTYKSNKAKVEAQLDEQVKKVVLERVYEYERILDGLFTSPKSGRIYGEERRVTFSTGFSYDTLQFSKFVAFTANKGKKFGAVTKSGRKSKKAHGVHQASAPGEAPAIHIGALRRGVKHVLSQIAKGKWSVVVGVTLQSGRGTKSGRDQRSIAERLEFGTSQMAARPAWRPALEVLRSRLKGNNR